MKNLYFGSRRNNLILLSLVWISFASPLLATIRQGTVEVWTGRYSVDEPRFQAVYPKTGPVSGLNLSSNLVSFLNFYLEIKYFHRQGFLTYTKEKTDFHLLPLCLGLRAIFPVGILHPYFGLGADFYAYYENNPIGTVFNFTNGTHALAGLYLQAGKLPLFLNLRVKYTRAQAEEEKGRKVQLGGWETGIGLAISF